ncbi:MAG TPA: peptidoglycan DD-metalloendopeptidase family protein [Halioglobus sp.]
MAETGGLGWAQRPAMQRFLLVLLWALWLTGLSDRSVAQSDEEKTREQLQQLEVEIKRISSEISDANSRHNALQEQLRLAEVDLGKLQRDISDNQRAMSAGAKELTQLQQQHSELEQARDQQQARIALELKTAWQIGRQGQLKILLNQENPHTVARSLGYYRYFFRARNTLLEQYRKTLRELEELQQRIDATLAELENRGQTLEKQQADLTAAQASRKLAMTKLNDSISSKSAQLKQKEQDRKQLEDLLRAIEKAIIDLQVPANYATFKSARGQMPWPVDGKPSNHFDHPRNEGKMRWQGVTIPAKEGTTVKAIHHGRVVYADWLRGSGLLLIIDHGDGYMSLYAHNASLMKEVGEWVTAGTPVSTVGNTGGEDQAALYFEIRQNGKPTNPSNWCKK